MRKSSTHVGFQLRNGFSVLLKLVVHCVSLRLAVQQRLSKLVHVARLELAWSRSLGCTSRVPRVTAAGALQRVGAGQSAGGWSKRHTLVSHGLECTPSHKHSHGNHNNNHNNTYTHTKAQEQPHTQRHRNNHTCTYDVVACRWWPDFGGEAPFLSASRCFVCRTGEQRWLMSAYVEQQHGNRYTMLPIQRWSKLTRSARSLALSLDRIATWRDRCSI